MYFCRALRDCLGEFLDWSCFLRHPSFRDLRVGDVRERMENEYGRLGHDDFKMLIDGTCQSARAEAVQYTNEWVSL